MILWTRSESVFSPVLTFEPGARTKRFASFSSSSPSSSSNRGERSYVKSKMWTGADGLLSLRDKLDKPFGTKPYSAYGADFPLLFPFPGKLVVTGPFDDNSKGPAVSASI
jgi:hypothetical protein